MILTFLKMNKGVAAFVVASLCGFAYEYVVSVLALFVVLCFWFITVFFLTGRMPACDEKTERQILLRGISSHVRRKFQRGMEKKMKKFFPKQSPDIQDVVAFIESVVILVLQMREATSASGRALAITAFVKQVLPGSLTYRVGNATSEFFDVAVETLKDLADSAFSRDFETQGLKENVDKGRGFLNTFRSLRSSPGYERIDRFLRYALSLGLFTRVGVTLDKAGFSRMEQANLKRTFKPDLDFLDCILDTTLWIVSAGYQAYQGFSVEHILHSGSAYAKFVEETRLFKSDYERLVCTGISSGVNHTQLLGRLSDLLSEYKGIEYMFPNMTAGERKMFSTIGSELKMIDAKLKNEKICQSTRPAPFSILLTGASSIGKSSLVEWLFHSFGKYRQLNTSSEYRYVRNPAAEFWDGFDPKMWCLVLDDIAFKHPKAVTEDSTLMDMISVINNVPFVPNQASLEKKGTTPFLGQLVIGTTNTPHLNAKNYFSFPAAVRRRFPYLVSVFVKPEFADEYGQLKVDPSTQQGIPNFWEFQVDRVSAENRETKLDTEGVFTDILAFTEWYYTAIDSFYAKQEAALNSVNLVANLASCAACHKISPLCTCLSFSNYTCYGCGLFRSSCTCGDGLETQGAASGPIFEFCMGFAGVYIFGEVFNFLVDCIGAGLWWTSFYFKNVQNVQIGIGDAFDAWYAWFFKDTVDYARNCGDRIQKKIIKVPPLFLALLGAGVLMAGFMAFFGGTFKLQSEIEPTAMTKEKETYYYNGDPMEITSFPAGEKGRCLSFDELVRKLEPNILRARSVSMKGRNITFRLFGIGGPYYITNRHNIPEGDNIFLSVSTGVLGRGVKSEIEFSLSCEQYVVREDLDLAMLYLPQIPLRPRVLEYFLEEKPSGQVVANYVDREPSGSIMRIVVPHVVFADCNSEELNRALFCARGNPVVPTIGGQCGMPLVAECGNAKAILGIHSLGKNNLFGSVSAAVVILRRDLEEMVDHFDVPLLTQGAPMFECPGYDRSLRTLDVRSPLRYIEEGSADVHGSFVKRGAVPRSRVIPTPISGALQRRGITTDFGPPVMGKNEWRPLRIALLDMVKPVTELDYSMVKAAADAFRDEIFALVDESAIHMMVHPLALRYNVNGHPGITYLDGIKRNTSAGFPFDETKKKHLVSLPPDEVHQDPVGFDEIVLARHGEMLGRTLGGETVRPVFTAHLKDEPVSQKKREAGKTRVFLGAPVDWSLLVRKYFLGHVRLIQNFRLMFETAVGIIAESAEWTELHGYLTQFGDDRMVAGDYKAFDKRMPPMVVVEAFRILIAIAEKSGNFEPQEIQTMWTIAFDTAHPLVNFFGDCITFYGSNPSGHPLTVIINSLVNSIYVRYAYMEAGGDVANFRKHVALVTYGDDNAMGVSKECDFFNHTVLAEKLGLVGITYTMPDKESISVPFVHISQVSFLKRFWRWSEELQAYLAPLEEESIYKMLCVMVASKTITQQEQIAEIIRAAQASWWHYGHEVFDEKTRMLEEVITECGLSDWFAGDSRRLLTHTEFVKRFEANSKKSDWKL